MRRILAAAGQKAPAARPVLEVNVAHPLVKYLEGVARYRRSSPSWRSCCTTRRRSPKARRSANAPEYVQRLNRLLVRLAAPPAAA